MIIITILENTATAVKEFLFRSFLTLTNVIYYSTYDREVTPAILSLRRIDFFSPVSSLGFRPRLFSWEKIAGLGRIISLGSFWIKKEAALYEDRLPSEG